MRPVLRGIPQPTMSWPMSSTKFICAWLNAAPLIFSKFRISRTLGLGHESRGQARLYEMSEVQRILDAIFAISSDLELPAVLERIVEVACDQTGARYGALGVLGADIEAGEILLSEFITEGVDESLVSTIGHLPRGLGILGHVIRHPQPLRLDDIAA